MTTKPERQTIDGLIANLQEIRAEHGNLEVLYREFSWGEYSTERLNVGDLLFEVKPGRESDYPIRDSSPDQQFLFIDTNDVV